MATYEIEQTKPTKAQYKAATKVLKRLDAVADAGGVIQAEDMVALCPGRPTLHTATKYAHAAQALGLEQDADGEWYAAK